MGFGRYRHKIQFTEPNTSTDGSGYISATSTDTYEMFADVRPMTGKRALDYEQVVGKNPVEVELRYNDQKSGSGFTSSEIKSNDSFTWNGKTFVVDSVVNKGFRNDKLILVAHVRD